MSALGHKRRPTALRIPIVNRFVAGRPHSYQIDLSREASGIVRHPQSDRIECAGEKIGVIDNGGGGACDPGFSPKSFRRHVFG